MNLTPRTAMAGGETLERSGVVSGGYTAVENAWKLEERGIGDGEGCFMK